MMKRALILMTRVPVPGRTKTRLMKILSGEECASLHKCFLLDLFNLFEYIKNDIDIYLTYTPENPFGLIKDIIPDYIKCFPQNGKDLGEKMLNGFDYLLQKEYSQVALMGADIPDIQPDDIRDAFEILDDSDIVLAPTTDGGYYLVGMNKVCPEIFEDKVKWGNKSVLEGTIDIANGLNLKVGLANKHTDIDTKEDLFSFMKKIEDCEDNFNVVPYNTINYLNNLWSDKDYAKEYSKG
ncbi:TIGR04282 family arsenosugar biosynthesis glycosyltransferase [Wukongibacter baidiensis]|uniref:TIGR04282 family arsenosugar biosynthesis glycosyltransferase n=1 Tax=Wukongibacter baidiensis TaxID=1723361 RepID=UPI003D7F8CCC